MIEGHGLLGIPKIEIHISKVYEMIRYLDAYHIYMGRQFIKDYVNDICERGDPEEIETMIYVSKMKTDRPWQEWLCYFVATRINFS